MTFYGSFNGEKIVDVRPVNDETFQIVGEFGTIITVDGVYLSSGEGFSVRFGSDESSLICRIYRGEPMSAWAYSIADSDDCIISIIKGDNMLEVKNRIIGVREKDGAAWLKWSLQDFGETCVNNVTVEEHPNDLRIIGVASSVIDVVESWTITHNKYDVHLFVCVGMSIEAYRKRLDDFYNLVNDRERAAFGLRLTCIEEEVGIPGYLNFFFTNPRTGESKHRVVTDAKLYPHRSDIKIGNDIVLEDRVESWEIASIDDSATWFYVYFGMNYAKFIDTAADWLD